mmetsp:Transcript_17099/g.30702  ORF Transcript_17099/g.30702 Transcript_17099/m.30702 type:complete len:629 (+) Transcript_17099:65-1951(+)
MWFSAVSEQDENGNKDDNGDTKGGPVKNSKHPPPPGELASASSSSVPPIHFLSRRSPIYCTKGCVATSQPLATSIGLHILRGCGGNAADASIAIAAALAVLEPCSTGLGGDMFALHYNASTKKVESINGSGKSVANMNLEKLSQFYSSSSKSEMESKFGMGIHSVTVPGAAQGWEDTHRTFGSGRLTLAQLLEPAATLAREGFPVSTLTSLRWGQQMDGITKWYTPGEIESGMVEMSVDGKGAPPQPGQLFRNPHMANVLTSMGEHGAKDGFYRAFSGKSIVDTIRKHGGVMTMDDLENHASTYPEPICVEYRGMNVWQIPPNGQGIAGLIALEGLNSLEEDGRIASSSFVGDDATHPQPSSEMLHAQIEMMRLGFGDSRAYVCDPDFAKQQPQLDGEKDKTSSEWLLDKERISKRALKLFDRDKAVIHGEPAPTSCTVSFQVVDSDGNAMSFVNSNFMGFGTGLTPKHCGFTLQNRGAGFSLDPTHPNALAPSKRPYHTIIPALMTHADTDELYATLSNMGGFMQPQGHLQLVVNMLTNGMDPQTAIDAPRFCIPDGTQDGTVFLEDGFHPSTVSEMLRLGHKTKPSVATGHEREVFGRAQIITRDRATGVLCAGSDGRADGCALGY